MTWSGVTQTRTNAHTLENSTLAAPLSLSIPLFLSISPTRACLQNSPAILGLDWLIWPTRVSWFRWIDFPLSIAEFSSLSQSCVKPNSLVVVFTVNGWLRCVGKRDFLWNSSLSLWNLKQLLEKWTQKRSLHCWIACDLLGVFPVISLVWVAAPPGHCWTPGQKVRIFYLLSSTHFIGWFNKCPCWCLASWDQLTGYSKNSRPISWNFQMFYECLISVGMIICYLLFSLQGLQTLIESNCLKCGDGCY